MLSKQTRLIFVLGALLLAVVAASALVLTYFSKATRLSPEATSPNTSPDAASTRASPDDTKTSGSVFNLKVLQRAGYVFLDKRLLNEKALPVQPPATVGKANPFL